MKKFLDIINVSKKFKDITVLDNINISFEKGKIHGIVGRNGSGKTMLLKCIAGLTPTTKGEIIISGKKLDYELSYPIKVGIIIENPGFLPNYSGFKNLKMLSGINKDIGVDDIRKTMNLVELDPDNKKHVSKYSLGMKQKLGLAQALMENPEILILDEPLNGIDLESSKKIHKILKQLSNEQITILIATHIKEDIDILCDTITYMDNGKIVNTNICD